MKVIYVNKEDNHTAFDRSNYCPKCGGHDYTIVHQLAPYDAWYVRCEQCGCESIESTTRALAVMRWRNGIC